MPIFMFKTFVIKNNALIQKGILPIVIKQIMNINVNNLKSLDQIQIFFIAIHTGIPWDFYCDKHSEI